jgi:flagellum-specific peptidoglycan hydrolase FlgJ
MRPNFTTTTTTKTQKTMRPAFLILALLFAHACATQPAPAQLEISETTYKAPKQRAPCYACLPQPKRRADSAVIAYIKQVAPAAIAVETAHGVPAALSIAVALYESGGGLSNIAQNTNNHFGIRYYGIEPQYIDSPRPYLCKKGRLWRSFKTVAEAYDYFTQTEAINIMRAEKQPYTAANFAATGYGGRGSKKRYAAHLQSIIKRYNLEQL